MNHRGWIFQEMLLSWRIIHFLPHQTVWQCHELLESEDGTYSETVGQLICWSQSDFHSRDSISASQLPHFDAFKGHENFRSIWWDMMEEFWSRGFTYQSDRIPALVGVTRLCQALTGDTPILGMWKRHCLTAWAGNWTDPSPRQTETPPCLHCPGCQFLMNGEVTCDQTR
jgi:hypothetical protein